MQIVARVSNTASGHAVEVDTDGRKQSIAIDPKSAGRGSSINGGELLFAALATCFCNDLSRKAAKRSIDVQEVKIEVTGIFLRMPRLARKRKFIVYVAISADGFIARPDGSVDWLDRPRPKGNYDMGAFYRSIDTCVLGRKTYDLSVSFGMAEGYAGKKNYVFSRTLSKAASPKVTIVSEDVPVCAERLRSKRGKDVWLVGGAELVAALLDSGQVDEFIIHIIPKMIGEVFR